MVKITLLNVYIILYYSTFYTLHYK